MRKYLFLLCMLYFGFDASAVWAATPQELFFNANKHYTNGNYEQAAKGYEAMLQSGIRGGHIYYNLGNAYYKLGKKGKALVNYLRAGKEIPHDGDVFTNLNFVSSLLDEAQVEEKKTWHERALSAIQVAFSPGAWFVLSATFFFLICLTAGACILKPTFRGIGTAIGIPLGILWIVCVTFHFSSASHERDSRLAVIIEPKVEVRYSPSYSGAVAFELSEGMKVKAVRKEGDWTQIRLTKDKSGWVPAISVEKV